MTELFADELRSLKTEDEKRINAITISGIRTALHMAARQAAINGEKMCSGFVAGDLADGYWLEKLNEEELKEEVDEEEYRRNGLGLKSLRTGRYFAVFDKKTAEMLVSSLMQSMAQDGFINVSCNKIEHTNYCYKYEKAGRRKVKWYKGQFQDFYKLIKEERNSGYAIYIECYW